MIDPVTTRLDVSSAPTLERRAGDNEESHPVSRPAAGEEGMTKCLNDSMSNEETAPNGNPFVIQSLGHFSETPPDNRDVHPGSGALAAPALGNEGRCFFV